MPRPLALRRHLGMILLPCVAGTAVDVGLGLLYTVHAGLGSFRKGSAIVGQKIAVKITSEGIVISHPLVEAWGDTPELEVEQIANALIIRPRINHSSQAYDQLASEMKAAGLVEDLPWTESPAISPEERARLAEKLGQGRPLSELILEERQEYA